VKSLEDGDYIYQWKNLMMVINTLFMVLDQRISQLFSLKFKKKKKKKKKKKRKRKKKMF